MPKTINITSRPPIRGSDSQLAKTENPGQSEDCHNDSQSFSHTESVSELEDVDHYKSYCGEMRRREKSEGSYSDLRTPQSAKPQYKQRNSPAPYVPESCTPNLEQPNYAKIITPLILMLVIAVGFGVYLNTTKKVCSFEELRTLNPRQEPEVWQHLTHGIESILQKREKSPGVYLFVHQGGEGDKQLVRDIALHSSSCFGHDKHPVEMESKFFNSDEVLKDYGYAINKFKEKIKTGNVILIADLNEIPAEAARALHTICDTISPIAPNLVIFLTLTVPDIDGGNIEYITEDTLNNLWGQQLKYNELDPLIARVTDQVIALKS